jgi:cyclophilin family peptidyl-prolyl cis-trans isomerase
LAGLDGATATMRLRGIGDVELALRFDDAPMAVHTFATLASAGKFNGLTFHRIVPNFVIQGGSPGADEYDPITDSFMRDEVGLARNARGSFGISTRGRDTGDGQIYVNLVNNFRLDHDYTVFAHVTRGLDLIDRVQEGDVIESIVVRRTTTSAPRRP